MAIIKVCLGAGADTQIKAGVFSWPAKTSHQGLVLGVARNDERVWALLSCKEAVPTLEVVSNGERADMAHNTADPDADLVAVKDFQAVCAAQPDLLKDVVAPFLDPGAVCTYVPGVEPFIKAVSSGHRREHVMDALGRAMEQAPRWDTGQNAREFDNILGGLLEEHLRKSAPKPERVPDPEPETKEAPGDSKLDQELLAFKKRWMGKRVRGYLRIKGAQTAKVEGTVTYVGRSKYNAALVVGVKTDSMKSLTFLSDGKFEAI